jgi:RimJ/RimL family protein N-acetyltransferase
MVEQNERAQADGFGLLGIRRRYETSPIGYCGLIIGRGTFEEPESAYEVLPQFRGHGYATEAAGGVIEAAFATGRDRLWATVGSWNAPSFRVLKRMGFTHITAAATSRVNSSTWFGTQQSDDSQTAPCRCRTWDTEHP